MHTINQNISTKKTNRKRQTLHKTLRFINLTTHANEIQIEQIETMMNNSMLVMQIN